MDPYVGEIRIFAGNYAPKGWAFCNGQILSIAGNTALFSLLGVTYGGDGKTTFALPNLTGRAPLHQGTGPGLTTRYLGEWGGEQSVTLALNEIPAHNHLANAKAASGETNPTEAIWASVPGGRGATPMYGNKIDTDMNPQNLGITGGSLPHNNMQPYLGVNFIIALEGVFPPRN
ncbi:microcystin-dependent protein [Bacillus oleivorans]|uniref:Microcystin-dependent protein n=1 Tax=Bacillus oleivorans TaxID=1448271 RepID=A0A285CHD9_9BACI|nr:tail fiber protein [Bacillus oleivorans]SNX67017.1 microcystin-dependent protein [Bacillus oleivorans]